MAEHGEDVAEVARWAEGIERVNECIAGRFRRPEPRRRVLDYLRGLLSPVERKNGWQLAEQPFGKAQEAMPLPTGCSDCCPPTGGMPAWSRAIWRGTCWSIWPTLRRFWWWTRPASSRKETSRQGCSASTAVRRDGSRTVRLGYSWPMPAAREGHWWTGSCTCPRYGRRIGRGGGRLACRRMCHFGQAQAGLRDAGAGVGIGSPLRLDCRG